MLRTKLLVILLAFFLMNCNSKDQDQIHGRIDINDDHTADSDLYNLLKTKDSLMFELSYNQLDFSILNDMATDDIEFYHDQAGATYTKKDFIDGMKGLGNLSYKARRELVEGSTQVFPMYKNGDLYAAILMGEHSFYAKEPNDKPEYLTSTAKYTTLWILEKGEWKMSRIYSYDHRSPEAKQ